MSSVVSAKLALLDAQRNQASIPSEIEMSIQRLSTGAEGASGTTQLAAALKIAERLNSQIRNMKVAMRNAADGVAMVQTAEGGLGKVSNVLRRMHALAVQSSNAACSASDRASLDTEFRQLACEVERTVALTRFHGLAVLAADAGNRTFRIGAGTDTAFDRIDVATSNLGTEGNFASVTTAATITSAASARSATRAIDAALDFLDLQRETLGAAQNRFHAALANLRSGLDDLRAARIRIMDVPVEA